jgi:hypothetical protein
MAEHDMDTFESRFAERLGSYASIPVAPVDADAIANAVVAAPRRWPPVIRMLDSRLPAAAWVIVALATAIAAGIVAGALIQHFRSPPGPSLVLALEDGLYVGEVAPGERRRIRDDGMFITPRWSPDGRLIAVLHGPSVPPQAGAGAQPRTPVRFDLRPDELLAIDPDGRTVFSYPGPIVEHAWAPPGDDGRSLLAVGTADGRLVVLTDDGRAVAEWGWDVPPEDPAFDGDLSPPRLAWASPTRLLAGLGGAIVAFDARDRSGPVTVASPGPARVTAVAVSPDGGIVAFLAADCTARCSGEVRVASLSPAMPKVATGVPSGRGILADVEASTALSWTADGSAVLAWPHIAPVGDAAIRRAPIDASPVLANRDIHPAWARYAPDGSGRFALLNVYPAYGDRHFDAWLLEPDGRATRIGERSLGFDVRSGTSR